MLREYTIRCDIIIVSKAEEEVFILFLWQRDRWIGFEKCQAFPFLVEQSRVLLGATVKAELGQLCLRGKRGGGIVDERAILSGHRYPPSISPRKKQRPRLRSRMQVPQYRLWSP